MKKYSILLFSFCLAPISMFAQNHSISLNINSFSSYQRLMTNLKSATEQESNGFQLVPSIEYAHVLKSKLVYTLQYSYAKQKSISSSSYSSGDSSNSSANQYKYHTQTHGIRIGFGKNTKFNKYLLYSGLSFPIQYSINRNYKMQSEVYNYQGQKIGYSNSIEKRPNQFSLGAFLTQSFYYPVYKQLYLGVELNLGLNYNYSKGIRTETGESVDSWGTVNVINDSNNFKERYSNMQFLSAISFRYTWGNK